MLKKKLVTFVVSVALTVAVIGASASVVGFFVPEAPAIACQSQGSSGGGC